MKQNYDEIFLKIAQDNETTVEEVKHEMTKALEAAMAGEGSELKSAFAASSEGDAPGLEDFISFVTSLIVSDNGSVLH